ncbi:MAG: DUF1700 domain-containing protein [Oscillospiraceae bacterium]
MTKDEFLSQLTHRLGYLPYDEVKKSVDFYREAIDDRMEEGALEEEAVAAMGSLDDIAGEIEQSMPLTTLIKQKAKTTRARTGSRILWIVLAICGFPIWLPLLIAFFVVFFSVYVVVWSVIIAIVAVLAALAVSGVVILLGGFFLPYTGFAPRLMLFGVGLVCAGVALLLVPATKQLAVWLISLTKAFGRWIKRLFIGRKEASEE